LRRANLFSIVLDVSAAVSVSQPALSELLR
jgi:hypothetical protein